MSTDHTGGKVSWSNVMIYDLHYPQYAVDGYTATTRGRPQHTRDYWPAHASPQRADHAHHARPLRPQRSCATCLRGVAAGFGADWPGAFPFRSTVSGGGEMMGSSITLRLHSDMGPT